MSLYYTACFVVQGIFSKGIIGEYEDRYELRQLFVVDPCIQELYIHEISIIPAPFRKLCLFSSFSMVLLLSIVCCAGKRTICVLIILLL